MLRRRQRVGVVVASATLQAPLLRSKHCLRTFEGQSDVLRADVAVFGRQGLAREQVLPCRRLRTFLGDFAHVLAKVRVLSRAVVLVTMRLVLPRLVVPVPVVVRVFARHGPALPALTLITAADVAERA